MGEVDGDIAVGGEGLAEIGIAFAGAAEAVGEKDDGTGKERRSDGATKRRRVGIVDFDGDVAVAGEVVKGEEFGGDGIWAGRGVWGGCEEEGE